MHCPPAKSEEKYRAFFLDYFPEVLDFLSSTEVEDCAITNQTFSQPRARKGKEHLNEVYVLFSRLGMISSHTVFTIKETLML